MRIESVSQKDVCNVS